MVICGWLLSAIHGYANTEGEEMKQNTSAGTTFYVAKNGNDASSGKRDAPFATLERARDTIRQLKASDGLPKGGVVVEIGGGTYFRTEPFVLEGADSGEADAPVVYRARKGETVRLVGGKRVTNFEPVHDAWALERLSPVTSIHALR